MGCGSFLGVSRGPSGDARVDQHRRRQVFDEQQVGWRGWLELEVELAPVGLPDAPLAQQTFDIPDGAVELAGSVDEMQGANVPLGGSWLSHLRIGETCAVTVLLTCEECHRPSLAS